MGQEEEKAKLNSKAHFVLIHGICGGAWCWYKIKCMMEASGYTVTCLDLKGSGIDPSDPNTIHDFEQYNKPLTQFLSALPDGQKVILVGHSAGGLSATYATRKFPNRIQLVVYVAATMLKYGLSTEQDTKDGVPDLSEFGDVMELGFELGPNLPPTSSIIKKEFQLKLGFGMSPREDYTLAMMLMRPGPLRAIMNAEFGKYVKEGSDVADRIPRAYVKTKHDFILKPKQQDAMISRWPLSDIYELESDHNPLFSAPFQLFTSLIKAAASAN